MTRKVVTRSPHREVGVVNASWLLDHDIEHESHLERRFIMIALSCPVLLDIEHQPFEIWLGPDKTHKYTPDFLITLADGSKVVIEVKPEVFLDEHRVRLDAARVHLSGMGYPFLVVSDKHIDAHGLSSRAILLMRYGRLFVSSTETLECRRILEEQFNGSASVKDLVEHGVSESAIWNLVATHQFRVPAGLSISDNENVCINTIEKEDCYAFICVWFGVE